MTGLVCVRCRCLNLDGGPVCLACGNPLTKVDRPRAAPDPARRASAGALWFDELEAPAPPPPQAAIMRARVDGVLEDQRARKKAARRAHVRRLLHDAAVAPGSRAETSRHVLILERHDDTRRELRSLLEEFGFSVMSAVAIDEVHHALVTAPPAFVAVFVAADQEAEFAGDGIELCQFLRDAGWIQARDTTAVFLLAATLRPADRVRALLAGCDEVISSPPSRGAVAGALDRRGIALPCDDRRA
jgi:CheY-like chemotaxis protein